MRKVKGGEIIPYGFSKEDNPFPYIFLKLPLPFIWKCKWYNVDADKEMYGWIRKDFIFKFALRQGNVAVGKQEKV